MANESKFGLVLGIVLVVAVAVNFYQNEPAVKQIPNAPQPSGAEALKPQKPTTADIRANPPVRPDREPKGQTASQIKMQKP